MTPPPSASASYDADYAHTLMEDLDSAPGLFTRAAWALGLLGLSILLLGAVLTYSPYDTTGDTAGLGKINNVFGGFGAGLANFLLQLMGYGVLIIAVLALYTGARGIFWPKKRARGERLKYFVMAMGVTIFGTAALSGFPIPQSWPMATGLGGWF